MEIPSPLRLSINPIFPLIILSLLIPHSSACRIDECSSFYSRTLDFEGIRPSATERYCQILTTYHGCINETKPLCRGNLFYHYVEHHLNKHWAEHNCAKIYRRTSEENRCILPPSAPLRSLRLCALFSNSHLRLFDGQFETSTVGGARTMVDNRFFLIQTTMSSRVPESSIHSISRITVMVKYHNCTRRLRYEAASDMEFLPTTFVDSSIGGQGQESAIEIFSPERDAVSIILRHADSSIHIWRQGPHLAVAVKVPDTVITSGSSIENQLCLSGASSSLPMDRTLSDMSGFSKCKGLTMHVPLKLATARCSQTNVTDNFFDSCVFDLVMTGDEYLVAMSSIVQKAIRRIFPFYKYFERGRMDTQIYDGRPHRQWEDCVVKGTIGSLTLTSILLLITNFIRIY